MMKTVDVDAKEITRRLRQTAEDILLMLLSAKDGSANSSGTLGHYDGTRLAAAAIPDYSLS